VLVFVDVAPILTEIFPVVAGVFAVVVQVSAVVVDVFLVVMKVALVFVDVLLVLGDVFSVFGGIFAIRLVARLAIFAVAAKVAAVFVQIPAIFVEVARVFIAISAVFVEVSFVFVDVFAIVVQIAPVLPGIFLVILNIGLGVDGGPESKYRECQQVCKKSSHIVVSPSNPLQVVSLSGDINPYPKNSCTAIFNWVNITLVILRGIQKQPTTRHGAAEPQPNPFDHRGHEGKQTQKPPQRKAVKNFANEKRELYKEND